jgi:membrane fusion protein (multidrug efflux system)
MVGKARRRGRVRRDRRSCDSADKKAARGSGVDTQDEDAGSGAGDERRARPEKGEGGDNDGTHEEKERDEDQKPKSRWPIVILVVVVLLAAIGGGVYWFMTRNQESTDDAYTEGNAVSITPKVSGYVVDLRINDNTVVKAGDLLLKIDPRDYITARDQARASLDLARAQLASAGVDLEITRVRAPASLAEAQAQLNQARANEVQAERDYQRQRTVDPRATTQTSKDQATTALRSSTANVSSAEAQVTIASLVEQNIRASEDTVRQRQAQVAQAEADLAQAELNLSYTEIRAPQDGRITRRNVDLGTYAQAGQQVFYLVTNDVWVTANFKETQLDRMRIGQRVDIDVDAYPGLKLTGHIDSIQGGSGARFSTFPAENATGNFVKIVRRVPVKILIDHGLEHWGFLPLGLSVVPTVRLK